MNANKFIIQICGILFSVTVSNSISKIVSNFSYFSLVVFLLTLFLAINFFFAKFKQLNDENYSMTTFIFTMNILTLACFAFMPFFMTSFIGIMATQIALRIFDTLLIFSSNRWKLKNIDARERGWLAFDFIYFSLEMLLVFLYWIFLEQYDFSLLFIVIYFAMAIFESSYDFLKHKILYGLIGGAAGETAQGETAQGEQSAAEEEIACAAPGQSEEEQEKDERKEE